MPYESVPFEPMNNALQPIDPHFFVISNYVRSIPFQLMIGPSSSLDTRNYDTYQNLDSLVDLP